MQKEWLISEVHLPQGERTRVQTCDSGSLVLVMGVGGSSLILLFLSEMGNKVISGSENLGGRF